MAQEEGGPTVQQTYLNKRCALQRNKATHSKQQKLNQKQKEQPTIEKKRHS